MRMAMKKMGVQQTEIEASQVVIRTPEHDLIFDQPSVSKINMMGQETYQIVGKPNIESRNPSPEISEEDVKTVMEQASCDEDTAKKAIQEAKGDLAEAILKLQ